MILVAQLAYAKLRFIAILLFYLEIFFIDAVVLLLLSLALGDLNRSYRYFWRENKQSAASRKRLLLLQLRFYFIINNTWKPDLRDDEIF